MSMYYAGYSALGLLLINEEINNFKKEYINQNLEYLKTQISNDLEEIEEAVDEWICCNEIIHADEKNQKRELSLTYVSPDQCDGMELYPASNYDKTLKYSCSEYRGDTCLLILADYQPSTIQQLAGDPFYKSYKELVEEFQKKMENLLPEDFPYDKRIGDFFYACYA